MRRGKRRAVLAGTVSAALIALAGGWYWGSPWWTLWRMREAARAGDVGTLASYVDFDAMRETSKRQLRREWEPVVGAMGKDAPLRAKVAAYAASRMSDRAVDEVVSPTMLRRGFEDLPIRPLALRAGGDARRVRIVRRGLDEFRASAFVFRRHGLGWRLAEVRLGGQ